MQLRIGNPLVEIVNSLGKKSASQSQFNLNAALERLDEPHEDTDRKLRAEDGSIYYWSRELISSPFRGFIDLDTISTAYDAIKGDEPKIHRLRGAIGFLLFAAHAEIYERSTNQMKHSLRAKAGNTFAVGDPSERLEQINDVLSDENVRRFICFIYRFDVEQATPSGGCPTMELLDVGATSYILWLRLNDSVLKLIKPQYFSNAAMVENTRNTFRLISTIVGDALDANYIKHSGDTWILMRRVQGDPLWKYFPIKHPDDRGHFNQTYSQEPPLSKEEANRLVLRIIDALKRLRRAHLDLSPSNILIKPQAKVGSERDFEIHLIDYGKNNLLSERAGALDFGNDLMRYSSPEVLANDDSSDERSDIYSLGVIYLELLNGDLPEFDLQVALDQTWKNNVFYAQVIEEMVQPNRTQRLGWSAESSYSGKSAYIELQQKLKNAQKYDEMSNAYRGHAATFFALFSPTDLKKYVIHIPRFLSASKNAVGGDRYLAYCDRVGAAVNFVLRAVIVAFFAWLLLYDLDGSSVAATVLEFLKNPVAFDYKNMDGRIASFGNEIFGRVLANQGYYSGHLLPPIVIFCALQYYNTIFVGLNTRHIGGASAWIAEVTIRTSPFVICGLGALTFLWMPQYWYFTATAGAWVIALNNGIVYWFCVRARTTARGKVTTFDSPNMRNEFFNRYGSWSLHMFIFGCIILFVGILLHFGYTQDAFMYALILAASSIITLYVNSTHESPLIRAGFARCIFAARRALRPDKPKAPQQPI